MLESIRSDSFLFVYIMLMCEVDGQKKTTLYSPQILQVSWSVPHKQATSGTYQVKFFDEESYSALRKVGDFLASMRCLSAWRLFFFL